MGNDMTAPPKRGKPPKERVLYSFLFRPCVEEGEHLDLEVLFHCERGEVGPTPLSQVEGVGERGAQLWLTDMGNPKYCIIVMHRGQRARVPRWSLGLCSVSISRRAEKAEYLFSHAEQMGGGNAEVYSVTLAPYKTNVNKFILYREGDEDAPESSDEEASLVGSDSGFKES